MSNRPPVIESFDLNLAKNKVILCAKKFVKEPDDIKRMADLEASLYELDQAELSEKKARA